MKYSFTPWREVEKTRTHYTHTGGPTTIDRRFTYDHAGRPLKVYHKVNSGHEVLLSWFEYNELGEPINIIHHSRNDRGNFMYKNTSSSTIQGWLNEIHYRYSDDQTVFKEKLDYQKPSGSANTTRFDGLVTSQKWQHFGSAPGEAYNYSYDIPKRLTAGTYRHKPASSWISSGLYTGDGIGYSTNGNINTLNRNKNNAGTSAQMDGLAYTYSGNRLTAVTDNAPAAHKADGFNDGNVGTTDYTYSGNGFLTSDANKGITSISYTILDRPQQVDFSTNGPNIRYTYSAGGGLQTVTYHSTVNGTPTKTLQYVGELVFENGVLTDINHEYGRVLANNGFKYQYYLTDYLGSTRVVLQEDPEVFTSSAGFEYVSMNEESEQFIGYEDVVRISADFLNHTSGPESSYAMRLTGGYCENMGLAKSVSVMPGDTVRFEVYGKYIDIGEAKRNPAVMAVLMAITPADPVGMGVDGGLATTMRSQSNDKVGLASLLTSRKEIGDAPPAYLNYLFFDSEMNYKYGGFVQMTNAAREDGSNVAHERLALEVVAEEPGYFYIYLSNDSNTGSEAFFDDFTIMTSESYIVQQIDYYPYGLIARDNIRTGDKITKELFQGKTYEELTGWYDFHARQYDAALGRWFGVDPQNQFASLYLSMGNNPVMMVDPDGEFGFVVVGFALFNAIRSGIQANNNGGNFWGAAGKSLAFSALNAAVSGGIGGLFGDLGATQILGSKLLGEVGRAGTHAIAGGGMSLLGGGKFSSGAAASFFGSLAGSGLGASGANGGTMIAGASFIGGTSSAIAGGDFWDGAIQSGIMAASNHLKHKMIESGKIGGTIMIDKQVDPPGFDYTNYKDLLQSRLVGEGFSTKTRVVDNTIGNSISAWWRGSPTAKVTIRNYSSSRDTRTGQAFARSGDANSSVVYNELSTTRTGKVLPNWRYVNATIHELGHALFRFNDYPTGIMSIRGASYDPNSSFNAVQRKIISKSRWGR